jgi:hypothetical protein
MPTGSPNPAIQVVVGDIKVNPTTSAFGNTLKARVAADHFLQRLKSRDFVLASGWILHSSNRTRVGTADDQRTKPPKFPNVWRKSVAMAYDQLKDWRLNTSLLALMNSTPYIFWIIFIPVNKPQQIVCKQF